MKAIAAMKIRLPLLLLLCAMLCGCEIPGILLHEAIGDAPVPAQYQPKKEPTLIFVENYSSPDETRLDGDQIAHQVAEELNKRAKLTVVDPDKLAPLREEDPAKFRAMTCQAVGRAVGAKQVIYVDLVEADVAGDLTMSVVHAHALAQVTVVDVESGNTLWPLGSTHGTELEAKADYDLNDSGQATTMRTNMISSLSSKIAKLFYSWTPEDADQENAGG